MRYKLLSRLTIGVILAAVGALAQTPAAPAPAAPAAPLAFEVASVKPAGPLDPMKIQSGQMRIGMRIDKALVDIGALSLMELICVAFEVKPYQVAGPSWLGGDRFNIQAKMPEGSNEKQVPAMLQALLAERFKLTFHRDTKENNVFALVIAKGGLKMKEAVPEKPMTAEEEKNSTTIGQGEGQVKMSGDPAKGGMTVRGAPGTGTMKMTMGEKGMRMEASAIKMEVFVEMLGRFVDKPVVDQTGLKGEYQIALELSMDDLRNMARAAGVTVPPGGPLGGGPGPATAGAPADAASDPGGGSIHQSIQQLGLRLEQKKAPVERLVIDTLEKAPTEN